MKSAQEGDIDATKKILDREPKLASYRDKSGRCVLHQAVLYDQNEIVEYLVGKYEALVGAKDNVSRQPGHDQGQTFYKSIISTS
jgi:ankyrin repeat protein